jgi:hypothetical protein
MTEDPNEAYEVAPIEPGLHGPPKGWWTVKRNGLPVKHFPRKAKAERYATDPEYRASLVRGKPVRRRRRNSSSTRFDAIPGQQAHPLLRGLEKRSVVNGNIFNSKGVHVAVVTGDAVFGLQVKSFTILRVRTFTS